jgi:hypothetical protein
MRKMNILLKKSLFPTYLEKDQISIKQEIREVLNI